MEQVNSLVKSMQTGYVRTTPTTHTRAPVARAEAETYASCRVGLIIAAYVAMSSSMLVINKVRKSLPRTFPPHASVALRDSSLGVDAAGGDVSTRAVRRVVCTASHLRGGGCGAAQVGDGGNRSSGLGQGTVLTQASQASRWGRVYPWRCLHHAQCLFCQRLSSRPTTKQRPWCSIRLAPAIDRWQ
jgi:hypothetical protein